MYKENLGTGIPTSVTPEIERVRRNQENFSSVFINIANKKLYFPLKIYQNNPSSFFFFLKSNILTMVLCVFVSVCECVCVIT